MNSAEGSAFPEATSFSNENPQPIQERGSRGSPAAFSDRSDQDPSHRGGGKWKGRRQSNVDISPTPEELETHSQRFEQDNSTSQETNRPVTTVEKVNPDPTAPTNEQLAVPTVQKEAEPPVTDAPIISAENGQITYPETVPTESVLEKSGLPEAQQIPEKPEPSAEIASAPMEQILSVDVPNQPSAESNIEGDNLDPLTASANQLIANTQIPGDKLGDLKLTEQKEHEFGQKYKVFTDNTGRNIELTPEQELDYAKSYLEKQAIPSTETQQTPTPERLEDDIRYQDLLQKASLDFLKTEDAQYFESRYSGEVSPNGYLIDNQGNETNFKPSQNISGEPWGRVQARAQQEFTKLYPEDVARYQNRQETPSESSKEQVVQPIEQTQVEPEKVDIPPQISNLIDNLEAGKVPSLMPNLARKALIKLGVTPAQLKEFESRAAWEEALAPLVTARAAGRLNEHVKSADYSWTDAKPLEKSAISDPNPESSTDKPESSEATKPEEKVDLNTKIKLTPTEMNQLIAEKQRERDPLKANPEIPLQSETNIEKKSNRVFSAAETARAKVAEVARAAALKTPGGKFLYNSAERYLNNFDWRDKDKIAWGTGIVFGFGTNTALNMALPGVGSLINSAGSTALTHVLAGGINRYRLRGIEKAINSHAEKLGGLYAWNIDAKSFRDQYDAASRLLRSNGREAYDTEMNRITEDFLTKLSDGKFRPIGKPELSELIEKVNKDMEGKVLKYSKANERIRSFAAGMKVGSITNLVANQFFDLDKFVEGKTGFGGSSGVENINSNLPEGSPPLTQEEIAIINRVHSDPELWKTFVSVTENNQWEAVGRLYQAEQLAGLTPEASQLIESLSNADSGKLVEIHQGDTIGTILENNGYDMTYSIADSDLIGGHILANHELLSDAHQRLVDAGLSTGDFPAKPKVIDLIESARAGDTAAFHELQSNIDYLPVNEKIKVLADYSDVTDLFEKKASQEIAEGLTNQ